MPPLTFLNSIFLVGLTAAALPILIHLFSRRRTREVRFPSLEFLQEVSRKKVRRIQLRQLLLLILRVLIIGLFALAMGRPAIETGSGGLGRGSSTVALILDNSFSMAARDPAATGFPDETPGTTSTSPVPEAGTVFAAAKKRALEIVSMMSEGDRGILAFAAKPVRVPYRAAVADLGLLRQEVERAALEATPANLPQAVDEVAAALASSRTLNRELYIVSDFQRIDVEAWQELLGQETDSTGVSESRGSQLPEGTRVYLVPARNLPVDNLAIERVRLDPLGAGAEDGARVIVGIVNYSDEEARDRILRALPVGEGDALGETYTSIPPMGRVDATLLLRRIPTGQGLRLSLAPDPLGWDNNGYLVSQSPGVRRVLVITGGLPDEDPAARYLQLALDPSGNQEFFQITNVSADDPRLATGIDADVVILLDVGRLAQGTLERIERFRAEGGGVLIVLGDRVDPRTYNTTILPRLASLELVGLQGDLSQPTTYRSLRVTAAGHPIFEGFPATPGANLSSARIHRLLQSKVGPDVRVLAEFSGGAPALVEDRGTLVFASAFDGRWSDLPTSGAFVPLLHRMVGYLISQGGPGTRLPAGSAIEETIEPDRLANQNAAFIDPQGNRMAAERSEREGKVHLKSPIARLPGIYRLVRDDETLLSLYAVNLDSRESDLRPAPEAWLPPLFDPKATILQPEGEITRTLIQARYGRELWPILLILVLGLMVIESFLGRGKILP